MKITKSSFKFFLQCKEYFWLAENKPEVLAATGLSDFEQMLAEQGKKVEQLFYSLYPDLEVIGAKGSAAIPETNMLIQQGASHIAQAGFEAEGFFAQADLVYFKGDRHIDIYEIKSSSSMQNMGLDDNPQVASKEEHITDLAFQYVVASLSGYIVDKLFLVELNKTYALHGEMNVSDLFSVTNVSDQVISQLPVIRLSMEEALNYSSTTTEPITCSCKYKPRNKQCPAFGYLHPQWTGYSAYDLARIGQSPKRLKELVDLNYVLIENIPANYKLLDTHRDQVTSWNENREIIHHNEIQQSLSQLQYPLYFLDYETFGPAIPVFEGTPPYKHIPFQYSLHILPEAGSEVIHEQYLHLDSTSPMAAISKSLRSAIGDRGTIIVWNKTFESKCNENLACNAPGLSGFLLGMNRRMFDLMEIFSKRLYVHKDFRGSASIKKVLPVLVPELSYKDLVINDGGKATTEWARMIFEVTEVTEKENLKKQLLNYCKLDTLAMVEIYKRLLDKI